MTNSKRLAGLLGPTLVVMTISEMLNPHIWDTVLPTQTYLAGSLWFVAGLSIIRIHNHWAINWSVLVTVIGWFALLGGLGRMFFPETVQQGSHHATIVIALQIVLLIIGIFLTFRAFSRSEN